MGGSVRFPEDLFADGEVAPLVRGEVLLDEPVVDAAEVGERVGPVLADVDLPVRVGNLINHLHGAEYSNQHGPTHRKRSFCRAL